MAMILSIVVPVYNVSRYLEKCINSLLNQNLAKEEYEIILVDDGSTDGSGRICDEYSLKESVIKVVHQRNQGLSAARNSGIRIACGTYIQFVDSDDFLQPNRLKSLISIMEEKSLDILRFGFNRVTEGDGDLEIADDELKRFPDDKVWEGKDFLLQKLWYSCYAWQFIIRRKVLENDHLWFKQGIIFEDTEWTPRLLAVCHRVSSIEWAVYNYLSREGSITNSAIDKKIKGQLVLIDELKDQMKILDNPLWHEGMIAHIVVSIISAVSKSLYPQRRLYLKLLKDKKVYPLSTYMVSKSGLRKIRLINISPTFACFLIHRLH